MKGAVDELLEHPTPIAKARGAGQANAMRSILFHVHDDVGLNARLQSALALARAGSAHLALLQTIPFDAFGVRDAFASYISPTVVRELEEHAADVRSRIEAELVRAGVRWSLEATARPLVPELVKHAALADLVIVGREPQNPEFGRSSTNLLGEILSKIHTPMCIPGDKRPTFDPLGKALVAWNGSIEAANAVRATIGLLKMASDVHVVRFTEGKDISLRDEQLLEYLSRHDIHARMETHLPKVGIVEDLIEQVSRLKSEYLIFGAYSHSRAGEFLFGGVTRALLRACDIPLVLAH